MAARERYPSNLAAAAGKFQEFCDFYFGQPDSTRCEFVNPNSARLIQFLFAVSPFSNFAV